MNANEWDRAATKATARGHCQCAVCSKVGQSCLLRLETNEIGGGFGRVSSGYHPLDGEGEQPTTEWGGDMAKYSKKSARKETIRLGPKQVVRGGAVVDMTG